MPILGADGLYVGTAAAEKAYLGAEEVWAAGGGTPTTYTLYPTYDGYLQGPTDAEATFVDTTWTEIYVGRGDDGTRSESFLAFDTSGVAGTITAVTFSAYGSANLSSNDFTIEVRLHDFGATLETGDWVVPADMASKTLLASKTTNSWPTNAYSVFTSEAAFVSNINQAGTTRFFLCSSRMRTGEALPIQEFVGMYSADDTGDTRAPKLVIEALV